MNPLASAYNIYDSISKLDQANARYNAAHRNGELPENRISDATRIALSAAKLRAGEQGLSDGENAARQGQLANIETGLGFSTDYNQLYGAYDKAGMDASGVGQNVAQGVQSANALAGMRYEGSDEQLAADTQAASDSLMSSTFSMMGSGDVGGNFQQLEQPASRPGLEAPDYLPQSQGEVSSMNQQDIVSMLLKLLQTKEIPRA